ncbi:hypothetical protein EV356DRAFT_579944 [Viridothelium virens]|uniref:Rhodopsin domain-containing protein n=1 Tax=Viridothelium virens TaxID=1048519 RepID=A0A6A6GXP7_VIRVR|nr:hypothetical protein EV356DRAFT_579944 [Viridothelium virens]
MGYYATPAACAFIGAFFPAIGLAAVVVRFHFRRTSKTGLGWDEWSCVLGWLFNLAFGLGLIIGVAKQVIGHQLMVSDAPNVQHRLNVFFQFVWFLTSFCYAALGFMKLSVLFLYRRIFANKNGGGNRTFDIINWTLFALVLLWSTIFSLSSFFMCGRRFSAIWGGAEALGEDCLDIRAENTFGCAFDVVGDVFIILLPLPMVLRLHMAVIQKVAVVATLLTGTLSLVCGILRLYINVRYNASYLKNGKPGNVLGVSSSDIIGTTTLLLFWSQIEIGVANIAICLPAMRPGRIITNKRSREFLDKIKTTLSTYLRGDNSNSRSRRSSIQKRAEPSHQPNVFHRSSNDELISGMNAAGISKTVGFDVQSVAGRYLPGTEADVVSRLELLQYPLPAIQKEHCPIESV